MSCSLFNVNDDESGNEPIYTALLSASITSTNTSDGLPSIDEFSQNTADSVNTICNLLNERNDDIFNLLVNFPPALQNENPNSEQQDFRSPGQDGRSQPYSNSNQFSDPYLNSSKIALPDPPLENGIGNNSVIGGSHMLATPSFHHSHHDETNGQVVVSHPFPEPVNNQSLDIISEPNEHEIDEAFQNVINGFSQINEKDFHAKLDADTLQSCLYFVRSCPVLICNSCLEVFQYIPQFQVHIQTCCAPPRLELKPRMDQAAMDQLARSLWEEVFLKELKKQPSAQNLDEASVRIELEILWNSDCSPIMIRCRDIFIRASVAVVSRRWVSNAIANELHRVVKANASKSKKRPMSESDSDNSHETKSNISSTSKQVKLDSKKRKPRAKQSKNANKVNETTIAIQGLMSEFDESSSTARYHFTPETPVSDHGIDVTPSSQMMDSRVDSMATPVSDRGVEFTPDMDSEIDRFVKEGKTSDVDLLAEAAKDFENLDNPSDNLNNGNIEEALSENEFVVGKILDRRLLYKLENCVPLDEDYEYLVSWDGYDEEENTWEPYDHLKHCTVKLKEFHDRLKSKALRSRRGKRI